MSQLWRRQLGSYRGLIMRCAPGTHEAAAQLLTTAGVPRASAIDLASGSGAFVARLRDMGWTDLDAVELDRNAFTAGGLEPKSIDLNSDFAAALPRRFGLVTALEIIEHLNCPRHFLAQTREVLEPGGYLLLSTPNIANWTGRLRFLLTGENRQFQEHDYHYQRHISPTTDIQLRLMFRETGLKLIASTVAGTFFGPLKRVMLSPVIGLARLFCGRAGVDDVRLYLLQRTEPDASSPGASSFYFDKKS